MWVDVVIRLRRVLSFRSSWWEPLEFVKISQPSRLISMCGPWGVHISSQVSKPRIVSHVLMRASPMGHVLCHVSTDRRREFVPAYYLINPILPLGYHVLRRIWVLSNIESIVFHGNFRHWLATSLDG